MNKRTQERKILAEGKVYGHSLPVSLRHSSPACALEDAKAIAYLLSHMVDAFAAYQSEICEKGYSGMGLVLDLLIDKLDIGSGSYNFPALGWDADLPCLAEREEDEV